MSTFLQELVTKGLLIPTGVDGVYGRSGVFEDALLSFDGYISRLAEGDKAQVMRFPPLVTRENFEKSGYLKSFPHLAGPVFSFNGPPAEHAALLERVQKGEPWADMLSITDTVLTPAACYPVYPTVAREPLAQGGRLVDVFSYCFRHEPSIDPARMQMFRMREFIRIGSPEECEQWRDQWIVRAGHWLQDLGLPAESAVANDPFFGRGGRMLALNQREQRLKFELVVPLDTPEQPTAIMSFNYHQEHFGKTFGIRQSDGEVAHTACVGFGMERVTLALFKFHGLDPDRWPAGVRDRLFG
jgi:seryl-tRNA synthetase